MCDFLAQFTRDDIHPLTKFLADPNPVLVFHILYILGKIEHPSTAQYLGPLVTHEDRKVREVTLHLLTRCEEKGVGLIQKFLRDPAPEIRGKASVSLARIAKDQAVKPLVEIILSEDFYKRDLEEKASFFRALGETRSKEAIPVLEEIVQKKLWFKGTKWNEMRNCAASALKMIGTERRLSA